MSVGRNRTVLTPRHQVLRLAADGEPHRWNLGKHIARLRISGFWVLRLFLIGLAALATIAHYSECSRRAVCSKT